MLVKIHAVKPYQFDDKDYTVTSRKNYVVYSKKSGNFVNDYIFIKMDKGKYYYSKFTSHKDDWDYETIKWIEIAHIEIGG